MSNNNNNINNNNINDNINILDSADSVVSSNTRVKKTEKTEPKFTRPALEEVKNYCLGRKNDVDAVRFFDFYESKGWMVGKNKMKDWRAAVRTWERGSNTGSAPVKTSYEIKEIIPNEINDIPEEFLRK
jgi:hypothetical protein